MHCLEYLQGAIKNVGYRIMGLVSNNKISEGGHTNRITRLNWILKMS